MNIIIYRYRSICEPDFIDAFKALGLDVIEDKQGMESDLSLDDRIIHLGNLIADNRPLFVFSINFYPFISMLCEKLHVFYVAVTVDCPVFEIFNTSIRSKFNRLFLFDKKHQVFCKTADKWFLHVRPPPRLKTGLITRADTVSSGPRPWTDIS